jgi:hypothetical protein
MAREEVFGAAEVDVRGACLFVARCEEDFGGRDEEDLKTESVFASMWII